LARLLGVSPEEAARQAYEAFGYLVERKAKPGAKPGKAIRPDEEEDGKPF
jgi:hypothetical protein